MYVQRDWSGTRMCHQCEKIAESHSGIRIKIKSIRGSIILCSFHAQELLLELASQFGMEIQNEVPYDDGDVFIVHHGIMQRVINHK